MRWASWDWRRLALVAFARETSAMKKLENPTAAEALPGRSEKMPLASRHHVLGTSMTPPFPEGTERAMFGMGCFWGAETAFWKLPGVHSTAVGYAAGLTPNPNYREVCTGLTGHNEVVLVVFDPKRLSYENLLKVFWESHDPTQGMRQGADVGTQYRSGVYTFSPEQKRLAGPRATCTETAQAEGYGRITRDPGRPGSTTRRTTTSSTSRRIREGIAVMAGQVAAP
jgi:peptide-methionine (S)-S-oxide reductase